MDALGFRVSTAGVGGYRVFFFLQQLSTPTWRRAGVRRRRTATGAGTRAGVRTATGAAYAGGRTTSRADVRRRVGIPIPNVKLPYYPLYVLGGLYRSTLDSKVQTDLTLSRGRNPNV